MALAKLIWGYLSHSGAMIADGYHSLFDGTSNVIGLIGMGIASRPADRNHPYGHSKYETYASVVIGLMLLFAAYSIGSSAVERLLGGGEPPQVSSVSFIVMIITLAINLFVTIYESREGKRLKSEILLADAAHTRSDVLVSVGVLVSLVLVRMGFPLADSVVSIFIAGMIVHTAWEVFKQANETLADTARIDPVELIDLALETRGVLDAHDARTRGSDSEVYLDMHVLVDPDITVTEGHHIAHEVEEALTAAYPQIVDITIHVEPFEPSQIKDAFDYS